jgi:hypothetical protein
VPGDDESHPTLACRSCGRRFPRSSGRSGRQPHFCSPGCRDRHKVEYDRAQRAKKKPCSAHKVRAGPPRPRKPEPVPKPAHRGRAATSEIVYDDDETEFMTAMDRFKREKRRPFPTWSEVLHVLKTLGYRKAA